ncbi:MAG: SAM-dependent methyltransferase, partial [Cyclobacteriaceae bacterium]|nr:SAM-dependent methyltransferase [Cyclobacteriaceae bacterium]
QGIDELGNVEAIHVVAVENECKELLFILSSKAVSSPKMICSNYKGVAGWKRFEYHLVEEEESESVFSLPQNYLYEPNASIMKAGGFKVIGKKFGVTKLHPNSHLYTSEKIVNNFPGRIFKITKALKYDSKSLLKSIPDKKANITCRNFPESVQQIRKKTKIKEGGDVYVFATTTIDNKKTILLTEKVVSHD